MATFHREQCGECGECHQDDGDTVHEPTVKEIDEIYNFILGGDMRFSSASEEVIDRMLLTLDRVSNSIDRREEKEDAEWNKVESLIAATNAGDDEDEELICSNSNGGGCGIKGWRMKGGAIQFGCECESDEVEDK
tara:strand:+ start:143 stop:547 length:405 start_codon:yes stop_codon:yes gene_type:complete